MLLTKRLRLEDLNGEKLEDFNTDTKPDDLVELFDTLNESQQQESVQFLLKDLEAKIGLRTLFFELEKWNTDDLTFSKEIKLSDEKRLTKFMKGL